MLLREKIAPDMALEAGLADNITLFMMHSLIDSSLIFVKVILCSAADTVACCSCVRTKRVRGMKKERSTTSRVLL